MKIIAEEIQRPNEDIKCKNEDSLYYSWTPPGISKLQVEEYMSQLPNNKVPRIGSVGEKYRQQQLAYQLPKQDFSKAYCPYLTLGCCGSDTTNTCGDTCGLEDKQTLQGDNEAVERFDNFTAARNELYLDIGYVKENKALNQECYNCKGEIEYSEMAVYSPKIGALDQECENISRLLSTRLDNDGTLSIHSKTSEETLKQESVNEGMAAATSERQRLLMLEGGEEEVEGKEISKQCSWHPACFVCEVCQELLVDLTHCAKDGHLYCERHFGETFRARCSACDELIFTNEYTKAMNKDWHNGHFACWNCSQSLTGKRYIVKEGNQYCLKCYEELFANYCKECKLPIGTDSKDISYKDKHWHEKCFACALCKTSLVDKTFASRDEKIYCTSCYDTHFASHCDGCGEVFKPGTKKMEYKGQQWHEKCFCCSNCKIAIGTKSFIPKDNKIYCMQCYEDKFATRCAKCHKVISVNGVTYKNSPYHKECFLCTNCSLPLAGQKFASKDEKPYCTECFAELFAKRCCTCNKPITGTGGTKFISFEDRNWHNECFVCSTCKTSLVGKGFINDGPDILCPACAKSKLQAKLAT